MLAKVYSGGRVTLLPGTTFLHINGALQIEPEQNRFSLSRLKTNQPIREDFVTVPRALFNVASTAQKIKSVWGRDRLAYKSRFKSCSGSEKKTHDARKVRTLPHPSHFPHLPPLTPPPKASYLHIRPSPSRSAC